MRLFCVLMLLGIPVAAFAEEEVQPHVFADLNGNGVSDHEENFQPGTNPEQEGIDEVELPPTPPEEGSDSSGA